MGQALYRTISHTAHDTLWMTALTENAPKGIASNIDTLKKSIRLSSLSTIFKPQNQALALQYIQTIKYRNLVIDLGNGVKTNAQLTLPAIGKGPFPGVLLISGSGANDKNETLGFVHKNGPKPFAPLWQIAQYLSERGFAVLRYDKRGVGANSTINQNVWGNATINDLIHDAEKLEFIHLL
jgi:hypothetical protein